MRVVLSAVAGVLVGLTAFAAGTANAEPSPPGPTTSSTSTSDDLADMVMDVIERGPVPIPTTTPVPAAPR